MMSVDFEQEYSSQIKTWQSLSEEVSFILHRSVADRNIKIHQIEERIKDFGSFVGKANLKKLDDPVNQINDVVGFRVVTLFRSSLPQLESLLQEQFLVISKDDKTQNQTSLGYQSIHYICEIKPEYIGPRYDSITNKKFEVQIRTLCMHAWAEVSHYLEYKGDWDVPDELKFSLQALSGLFHVADNQFEQFASARTAYQERIKEAALSQEKDIINLDSLNQYLIKKFSDRRSLAKSELSTLVHELKAVGINKILDLDSTIDEVSEELKLAESKRRKRFASVGAVRISVALARQDYRDLKYSGQNKSDIEEIASKD